MKLTGGCVALAVVGILAGPARAGGGVAPASDDEGASSTGRGGGSAAPAGPAGDDAAGDGDESGDNPRLITPEHHGAAAVAGGHYHQLGVGLQFAVGMRGINPYTDGQYCGARDNNGGTNAAYCLTRAPMSIDLELTYGVKPALEALFEIRLGVERDFGAAPGVDGPRVHQFAPGARFFFSESGRSKFFSTIQAVLDTTGYQDATGTLGADLGVRNVNGFWFDIHHAYGFYVFFGEEVGFKRWLSAGLEAGLGIQGRYP